MNKINFVNNQEPALNSTNLNLLQSNIETEFSRKVPMKNSTDNNVNCDNYYETGIYYLGSGLTNAPASYIKLIVAGANKGQKGDVTQIAIAVSSGSVYIRTGIFSSSEQTISWHNWITVYQNIETGTPFATGRTIDGKIEYGKRVRLGNLPNNEMKNVAHGLSNITFTKIEGVCDDGLGDRLTLPFINIDNLGASIMMYIDGANIRVKTYSDKSTYVGYATLYYTKN